MIGVTLSRAPMTMAIFRASRATSVRSILGAHRFGWLELLRRGDPEFRSIREQLRADAAENLQVGGGLSLRRIGFVDPLLASLKIGERSVLLRVNRGGQEHVGHFIERMVRIPGV